MFSLAVDLEACVADNYSTHRSEVVWAPTFRRALFDWEISRMIQLLTRLQDSHIDPNQADRHVWKVASGGEFSMRSCYSHVVNHTNITAHGWVFGLMRLLLKFNFSCGLRCWQKFLLWTLYKRRAFTSQTFFTFVIGRWSWLLIF